MWLCNAIEIVINWLGTSVASMIKFTVIDKIQFINFKPKHIK